ncbi:unnamed protein product [Linum trigynum]|uniref:Uncharacterized protein n=1 Tax=Linum trigynum TaxID=586398 RepID=A0AAV2GPC0_9ROSI
MDDVDKREDEIELELGLSLGGNCNTRLQKFISVQKEDHERKSIPESADLGFGVQACTRFGELSGFTGENSEQDMDPKMKRKIQEMRRHEAKKKRGKKKLKMALSKGKLTAAIGCSYPANAVYMKSMYARGARASISVSSGWHLHHLPCNDSQARLLYSSVCQLTGLGEPKAEQFPVGSSVAGSRGI